MRDMQMRVEQLLGRPPTGVGKGDSREGQGARKSVPPLSTSVPSSVSASFRLAPRESEKAREDRLVLLAPSVLPPGAPWGQAFARSFTPVLSLPLSIRCYVLFSLLLSLFLSLPSLSVS